MVGRSSAELFDYQALKAGFSSFSSFIGLSAVCSSVLCCLTFLEHISLLIHLPTTLMPFSTFCSVFLDQSLPVCS